MQKLFDVLFALFSFSSVVRLPVQAQPGSVDATFVPGLHQGAVVYCVAVQPDGQILIGGDFYALSAGLIVNVARLNPDGSVDPTFNPGSLANGPSSYVDALAVQADGKILVGGSFTSSGGIAPANLARLNSNGSVDSSFSPSLYIDGPVNAIVLQPDQK